MSKIGELVQRPIYTKPLFSSDFVIPHGKVGIEIETENWKGRDISELAGLWEQHEDGSLRNNGMEFTTNGGVVGEDITRAVYIFCGFARKHKLSVGYPRAGIHLHIDCTDMDMDRGELSTMVAMYLIMEHALFGFAGEWRRHCGFCDPLISNHININALRRVITNSNISSLEFRAVMNTFDRYCGINFKSLLKFGTIEFRHLRTLYDEKTILTWINIIFQLKKSAQEWDPKSNILREFSHDGPVGFGMKLMGPMWPELSQYFDEEQAWAAIDSAISLTDRNSQKKNAINWDSDARNPILDSKVTLRKKRKPVKKTTGYICSRPFFDLGSDTVAPAGGMVNMREYELEAMREHEALHATEPASNDPAAGRTRRVQNPHTGE